MTEELETDDGHDDLAQFYEVALQRVPTGLTLARWEDPPERTAFRFLWANEAAYAMAPEDDPVSPKNYVGKRFDVAFPALVETDLPDRYVAAMTAKEPQRVDGLRFNDTVFEIWLNRLSDDLLLVTYLDVGKRVLAEERRNATLEELQRSNHELDTFAHVISHDLKAPLRDIRNLSEWVIDDLGPSLPATSLKHVRTIIDRSKAMNRMLEDLLTFSQAGRRKVKERAELRQLFADVRASVWIPPGFDLVAPDDARQIETSRPPLEVVLRNLVANAVEHQDQPHGRIEIELEQVSEERVAFTVSDDGPGIPAKHQERVFEIFSKLRDSSPGTGFGLALVAKKVEARGGEVELFSEGRGTRIRFTWPATLHPAQDGLDGAEE